MNKSVGLMICLTLAILSSETLGQGLARRFMYGFNAGTQKLVTTQRRANLGVGGEGLFGYRLSNRFGASFVAGYSVLHFNFRGLPNPNAPAVVSLDPNIVYGSLLFDYMLAAQGKLRPYLMAGIGGVNYRGFKVTGAKFKSRRNTGSGVVGLGIRYFIAPQTAINLNGAYHLTGTDAIDTKRNDNDAFVTARLGLTFFSGGSDMPGDDLFTEIADEAGRQEPEGDGSFVVESSEPDDDYSFSSSLNEFEDDEDRDDDPMQEYARLQSQVDELSQDIDRKEGEIGYLREEIEDKNQSISKTRSVLSSKPESRNTVAYGSFSRAYEDALNSFYLKRYDEAIQKFNVLVRQFPSHTLASNCHYWRGEAEFGASRYQAAIESFNRVLGYQKSLKKDDALLMLGRCFIELNRRGDARDAFTRLIRDYPSSEYIAKAEEYLNKM